MAQSSASSFPFPILSLGVTSPFCGMCLVLFPHPPSFMVPSSVSIYFPDNILWICDIIYLYLYIIVSLNDTEEDHH